MELVNIEDILLGFFYLAVNKLITDKTQNIFLLSTLAAQCWAAKVGDGWQLLIDCLKDC